MTRIYIAANGKPFNNLEQCAQEDEAVCEEADLDHLYDVLSVYKHKTDTVYPAVHAKVVELLELLDVADLLNMLGVKS